MEDKLIFTEELPVIGKVPMVFVIPYCDEKKQLKALIENYGGKISEFHECFTYQIEPIKEKLSRKHYFRGEVYSAKWLIDSVKQNKLLDRNDYFSFDNQEMNIKKLRLGKGKVLYTITEAYKVYVIAQQNQRQKQSATFWKKIADQGDFPERTGSSLREFFKINFKLGDFTDFMKQALEKELKYSHAIKEIPRIVQPSENNTALIQLSLNNWETNISDQNRASLIDDILQSSAEKAKQKKQGVITYNLKDMSSMSRRQQPLTTIFSMIDSQKNKEVEDEEQESSQMEVDQDNKENNQQNSDLMNADELLEAVEKEGLIVYKKDDFEKRQVHIKTGKEAYFVLLAQDMLSLADKYKRNVEDLHNIFYQVSCDRDKLIKILEGQKLNKWTPLEDLALKSDQNSEQYKYIVQMKGKEEVELRKQFLEFQQV